MTSAYRELFDRPAGGTYPKVEELEGKLLLIKPSLVETVRNQFAKTPEDKQTVERATADVTVFEDDGTEQTYSDMFLSQQVLLNACKGALKPGRKPMVVGRLVKVATKESREKLKIGDSAEDFANARTAWLKGGGKGPEPKHVWILQDFTEEDENTVVKFLQSQSPIGAAEG